MDSMTILWPTLLIGIIIFFISYIKMRERIMFDKRDKIEKIIVLITIILLLVDIGFVINERRILTEEFNDCIRYYRYYPGSTIDKEFFFIKEKCYKIFNEYEIKLLRESGMAYQQSQSTENPWSYRISLWTGNITNGTNNMST